MTGVSIIICCFNSSNRLPDTISHLGRLLIPENTEIEIIIVDNASTDNTKIVAEEKLKMISKPGVSTKIIAEAKAGLSFARETGVNTARFEYVLFCDDDNWLDKDYIRHLIELFELDPLLAAVGGNNKPRFEVEPPNWFKYFYHSFAVGHQSEKEYELLDGEKYIVGAGMAIRKSAYRKVINMGFEFYLKDRTGTKLTGGGDVELSYLFRLAGFRIAATSKLELEHYIPANRLTESYLKKLWQSYPHSWLVFDAYRALLVGKFNHIVLRNSYWKTKSIRALFNTYKILKNYTRAKIQGNFVSYLPIETEWRYNVYRFSNASSLVAIIKELKSIRDSNV
jgi:glycosyltransferase involved in cell wall biosynthesis